MAMASAKDIFTYDLRNGEGDCLILRLSDGVQFQQFITKIHEIFSIAEEIIICNTNRDEVVDDDTLNKLQHGDAIYILRSQQQLLQSPTKQRIQYLPHYDTLVKSGMYEYYASEGQDPLPFAFAELIDNSLTATAGNEGSRNIEIRLMLDDRENESAIIILDNGQGMTPKQLNDWAIYRKSKFLRSDYSPPEMSSVNVRRWLNSNMSYFGVGGKQGAFFIGNAIKVITKTSQKNDVHEFSMSEDQFKLRESQGEEIYCDYIYNRRLGDSNHVSANDRYVRRIITEEMGRNSFTFLVIQGIKPAHVQYLKTNIDVLCTRLAHTYHYYVHGPNGNDGHANSSQRRQRIEITVQRFQNEIKINAINLRDIANDFQSLLIRSAACSFEFKALVEGIGSIEGVLRYHPYLYDKETYPTNDASEIDTDDDHEVELDVIRPARGKKPIFECYWNGRLIPYTSIEEFDWCSTPKTSRNIPLQCYNRLSGVIWTNDKFEVSTNKLTFMDLEGKLCEKSSVFTCVVNGKEIRGGIEKQFRDWLMKCHQEYDKQVRYLKFLGTVSRPELPKAKQHPWSVYNGAEWDGKVFRKGQLVRMLRVNPSQCGTILRFLVFGEQDSDGFAANGFVEISREPEALYNEIKIHPIFKIDRAASKDMIQSWINDELTKLPSSLNLRWAEGSVIVPCQRLCAGRTIGPLKVEIANKRGEVITSLPGSNQKKLLIDLTVIWHGPKGIDVIVCHSCESAKNSSYYFKKSDKLTNIGSHSIVLEVIAKGGDLGSKGDQFVKLPSVKIDFVVTEDEASQFLIGMMEGPFHIGLPFTIPLEFTDQFGNCATPDASLQPTMHAKGLQLSYNCFKIKGRNLLIEGVIAEGIVRERAGQVFSLIVTICGMGNSMQKIRIFPGRPAQLKVMPFGNITIENGNPVVFDVEVQDVAGNAATFDSNITVECTFKSKLGSFPCYMAKCSALGQASLTGPPITIDAISGPEVIEAIIGLKNNVEVPPVEKTIHVLPSSKPSKLTLKYSANDGSYISILPDDEIFVTAGETIKGLEFELHDEMGRSVKMESVMTSTFSVNWAPRLKSHLVSKMKLPDISVPFSVEESKYCHVIVGPDIQFGFTVRAVPGEPFKMNAECVGSNKLRLDNPLEMGIAVLMTDKHGNAIEKFSDEIPEIRLSGEGLQSENVVMEPAPNGRVVINGISFKSGPLGQREVRIKWRNLTTCVSLEMVADLPVSFVFPGVSTDKVITVVNNHHIKTPLIVQLVDKMGNPCTDADVKIEFTMQEGLKISPALQTFYSDKNGRVDCGTPYFSTDRSINTVEECPVRFCVRQCLGIFELQSTANLGRHTLGLSLYFHILPDSEKPVRIQVQCSKIANYVVGSRLEEYKVSIIAEDQNILQNVNRSHVTMTMWKSGDVHIRKLLFHPTVDMASSQQGIFPFRKQQAPELAGKHNIQFVFNDGTHVINSDIITVNLLPGKPVKLVTTQAFTTPTVSNKHMQNRTIIKYLKLEMRDAYGNPAGQDLHGQLLMQVKDDFGTREIPTLVGGIKSIQVPIKKGQVILQNIMIAENSQGLDGQEYYLQCTVQSSGLPKNHIIPSYNIPFVFCNDVVKKQLMGSLGKERDCILNAIQTYHEFFNHTRTLCATLEDEVRGIEAEEQKLRLEIGKFGIKESSVMTLSSAKEVLKTKLFERDWNLTSEKRKCNLAPSPNDPQVIGKVGHLATIQDAETARVLSWHMANDMDCIVTRTLQKAEDIYKRTRGDQQVISVESLHDKKMLLDSWKKPLPHMKIPRHFEATGEPVYARDLLIFSPEVSDECKIVFGTFLGDAILINTLEDGNKYRKEVVKYTSCPTILTRNGERIQRSGKFGGKSNCAPPLNKMNVVFAEPDDRSCINTAIELLEKLCSILVRKAVGKRNLEKYEMQKNGPEMQARRLECEAKEAELKKIEKQLDACSSSTADALEGISPSQDENNECNFTNSSPHSQEEQSSRSRSKSRGRSSSVPPSRNRKRSRSRSRRRRYSGTFAANEASSAAVNTPRTPRNVQSTSRNKRSSNLVATTVGAPMCLRSSVKNSSLNNGRDLQSGAWDDSSQRKRPRT